MFGPQFRFTIHPAKDGPAVVDVHDTTLSDTENKNLVGYMEWDEDELRDIAVLDPYQRRGVATEMWKKGQQAHKEMPFLFPQPKHSPLRTQSGDQWAQSVYKKGLSAEPPENTMDPRDEEEYDR